MYMCKKCGNEYETKQQLGGHGRSHNVMPKRKLKIDKIEKLHICKYCFKQFDKGNQLGGHVVLCKLNPNYDDTKNKISKSRMLQRVSDDTKLKITKSINEKIKNGTWHVSFSKRRIHEYNGIKFNGTWELRYAKYLDENSINWRRPTESFLYIFEGKSRRYTPDFYVIDDDLYIEIKGYETPKDRAKWEQFPLKLQVLKGKELKNMGIVDSYKDVSK